MIVPYGNIMCQECLKLGKSNCINFDMDANKFACSDDHEISEEQFKLLYETSGTVPVTTEKPVTSSSTETIAPPPSETKREEPAAPVKFTDPAPLQGVLQQADVNVKAAAKPEPADVRVPDILNLDAIVNGALRGIELKIPGGDVIIPVRLPEQYVAQIKEYAESQKLTLQEYINQRVAYGAEVGWFV